MSRALPFILPLLLVVGRVCAAEPVTLAGHDSLVLAVAFSPDGSLLAAGVNDGAIVLWDLKTRKPRATLKGHAAAVTALVFAPHGETLASGGADNRILLWDVKTAKERRALKGHTDQVQALAFARDGKTLASAGMDNVIKLWDPDSGKERRSLQAHKFRIRVVSFSGDGATLISGSIDNSVKFWDVTSGKETKTVQEHTRWILPSLSRRTARVCLDRRGSRIQLWDGGAKEKRSFAGTTPTSSPRLPRRWQASRPGDYDHIVKLWDAEAGKELATFKGHGCRLVRHLLRRRQTSASGSSDKTVKIWDEQGQITWKPAAWSDRPGPGVAILTGGRAVAPGPTPWWSAASSSAAG